MNDGNSEIVTKLKSIKKWVIAGAIGFLLIGLSAAAFTAAMVQMTANFENSYSSSECSDNDPDFSHDKISGLIKQNKLDDALALLNQRLKTHPNDPYAHWYKARIHVLTEEFDLAQEHIEKMEVLAPSWEKGYIAPLRRKIRKLSE